MEPREHGVRSAQDWRAWTLRRESRGEFRPVIASAFRTANASAAHDHDARTFQALTASSRVT